jgi:hypothetical protein
MTAAGKPPLGSAWPVVEAVLPTHSGRCLLPAEENLKVDFWDLTKLVFRRWYVALPMLVLTGLGAFWTAHSVSPDYKATAYVQLIPPPEASITENIKDLRNPWLDLGLGAVNTAASYATVDKTFLNQLKDQGLSDNVVITDGYPAPIAIIEVIGNSKQQATATSDQVVSRFSGVVKSLQDDYGVRERGRIVTRRLDTGKNLEETGGKVKRALVAVAGAGALLTAGLTVAFDALVRRRSRPQAPEGAGQAEVSEDRTVLIASGSQRANANASPQSGGNMRPPPHEPPARGRKGINEERTVFVSAASRANNTNKSVEPDGSTQQGSPPITTGGTRDTDLVKPGEAPDTTIIIPRAGLFARGRDDSGSQR